MRGHGLTRPARADFARGLAFEGSDEEERRVFNKVYRQIMSRISQFVNLPLHVLDHNAMEQEMRAIGKPPVEDPMSTTDTMRNNASPAIGFSERYLTVWLALCIVAGIGLGQVFPGLFHAIGGVEVSQVNLPMGVLI